jgi:hypothetical protein
MWKKIFAPEKETVTGDLETCIMKVVVICKLYNILLLLLPLLLLLLLLLLLHLQLSCHSVAVVLTLVQTKQIRIIIHMLIELRRISSAQHVASIGQKINKFRASMMNLELEQQLGIPSLR